FKRGPLMDAHVAVAVSGALRFAERVDKRRAFQVVATTCDLQLELRGGKERGREWLALSPPHCGDARNSDGALLHRDRSLHVQRKVGHAVERICPLRDLREGNGFAVTGIHE